MINRIGPSLNVQAAKISHSKANYNQNKNMQSPIEQNSLSRTFPKSYISFGSNAIPTEKKIEAIKKESSDTAKEMFEDTASIARQYGDSEINEKHLLMSNVLRTLDFIDSVENAKEGSEVNLLEDAMIYTSQFGNDIFSNRTKFNALKGGLENLSAEIDEELSASGAKALAEDAPVSFSKSTADTLYDVFTTTKKSYEGKQVIFPASFALSGIMASKNKAADYVYDKLEKLSDDMNALSVPAEVNVSEETIHLSAFDDKAKKILKNLSLGVNMFVLSDAEAKSDYLISSMNYVLNDSESQDKGKLNKDNTTLSVLDDSVTGKSFVNAVSKLAEDTSKNHIVVFNQDNLIMNDVADAKSEETGWMPVQEYMDVIENPPKNIMFVATQKKETFYGDMKSPIVSDMFRNFGNTTLPMLSPTQVKQAFREQPTLMYDIDKKFTPEAMDMAIEVSALLDGEYPEKAQSLMRKLSIYYVDKDSDITVDDVNAYMEEAKALFKGASDDGKIQVIFDTGKNLSQFLGKEATKREAELIVKEMKAGTLGTKGMLIYSADDTVGAGRRFTAQAIAGEAKAPYVEVNGMDFSIKETQDGGAIYPDDDIKKMFSLLRAQADANPDKSAVLYVENFEYFMAGDEISSRYMNLMPIIQREMKNANDKGLNILVLGSVSNSHLAGSSYAQSAGFADAISVDTPAFDIDARGKIVDKALKDLHLTVAGSASDKAEFLKYASQITEYFSFADMTALMKKARSVGVEREHTAITKADLVEAYLQLTTGRLAASKIPDYEKTLVASHECGHATNLEVMRNLALDNKIPWREPEKVNFITLDPRGWYGGAVYFSSKVENPEMSFEKMFADVVCSYGGHSAEKKFFDVDGSYGITADLESATSTASQAVMSMGQGAHTGKISVKGMLLDPTEEQKEIMRKDIDAIMDDALLVSDDITAAYADFNEKFAKKYGPLVGTGACIVLGEEFRKDLKNWISQQTPEKKAELKALDEKILDVISYAKKGLKYSVAKLSSSDWYKTLSF